MEKVENYQKKLFTIIGIGVFVFIVLGLMLFLAVDFKKKSSLKYRENSSLDYNVYLKKNDFYETPYLPKNKKYISALIDYIDTKFDYSFTSDQNIDMKYSYYIDGTLEINDSDGKNIYEKKYKLLDKKTGNSNGRIFNINENLKINYDKYNVVAKKFINQYNVSNDAKLVVRLHVNVTGTHQDFTNQLADNGVIELEIPLISNLNAVEFNEKTSNKNDALLEYSTTKIANPVLFFIVIILMIVDIVVVIAKVLELTGSRDASTIYNMKLNKIKKDYDRYISETVITQKLDDLLKTRSLRIILVKQFDDLLDIRDNVKSPILFHEEIPGIETVFYIIADNVAYLYVMHVNNFKSRKKLLKNSNSEEEIEILIS